MKERKQKKERERERAVRKKEDKAVICGEKTGRKKGTRNAK